MTYKVFVDDNFHYMDESERYEFGEFSVLELVSVRPPRRAGEAERWAVILQGKESPRRFFLNLRQLAAEGGCDVL